MITIYALIDPTTRHLGYVGKTIRKLNVRHRQHINDARWHRTKGRCSLWIYSLLIKGAEPIIIDLETVGDGDDWQEAEKFWIAYYRFIGCRLANLTEGGDGSKGLAHSDAAKEKIGRLARERAQNKEHKEYHRERTKRAMQEPAMRDRMIKARREKANDPEFRKKQSDARIKLWETEEYRNKVVSAQKLVDRATIAREFWSRPEYRANRPKRYNRSRRR